MTQKSLLHAVAAQIANGYETAEVPMYSEHLRMPDRKVIIKIIENLQKVFFPAYFAGGTVSHVSAETFAEFLLGEIYTDLREQVHLAFSNTIADESELRERTNAVCDRFLCRLPQIQTILMKDVTANFDGDPAAGSKEEVICASSSRSAEMSMVVSAPRCTPPMPPVAKTEMPAMWAIIIVVVTVVAPSMPRAQMTGRSRRETLATLRPLLPR